jgi:hypothetical protein
VLRTSALAVIVLGVMLVPRPGLAQIDTDPSIHRPVTADELARLRRQITEETRSSIEALGAYHYESGNLNERLDLLRAGGGLTYRWRPATRFSLGVLETRYRTQDADYSGWGTNVTLGVGSALTDAVRIQAELGATFFTSTDTFSINGLASVAVAPIDTVNLYATVSRSNVEESLLSATGLRPRTGPFAGELVGRVMETKGIAGGTVKLPYKFDVLAEGGVGARDGSNVGWNVFGQARGGLGYEVISRADPKPLSFLRLSYQLNYFGFEEDRSGFGGASMLTADGRHTIPPALLGSDGISPNPSDDNPGVGGYFSPSYFVSNTIRADVAGRVIEALRYRGSAFAGTQSYTDSATRGAFGVALFLEYALTDRVSFPLSVAFDNVGPFTQLTASVKLVIKL